MVLLAANAAFPRASDPWDVPAVLLMMVNERVLRQISFVALIAGLWAITAGLLSLDRWLRDDAALARLARHLAVVGVTLFTSASALGMAASAAAVEWGCGRCRTGRPRVRRGGRAQPCRRRHLVPLDHRLLGCAGSLRSGHDPIRSGSRGGSGPAC